MRRFLDLAGRSLITVGLLTVLFVVYQLWGTNLVQAREQRALKQDFREELTDAATPRSDPVAAAPSREAALSPPPEPGEVIGLFEMPAIGIEQALVEGAGTDDLRKGPGHYPHSVLPGRQGNSAIAGHRTTYGAPFHRIDELGPGDAIIVTTLEGRFVYRVTEQLIVDPEDVWVIMATSDSRITLTTCEPKYSARERLIVVATLDGDPVDAPTDASASRRSEAAPSAPVPPEEEIVSLDGPSSAGWGAVDLPAVLALVALLVVGGGWWWAFRRRRRLTTWLAGAPVFLVTLFAFYFQLEQLLPSSL